MAALLLLARAAALLAALAGILVGIVIGVVAPLADVTFAPVLSPSMRPALREGDLLVVRRVPTSTLELGAIVLLERDATTPSAHRVVALSRGSEGVRVRTRGDANPADDPERCCSRDARSPSSPAACRRWAAPRSPSMHRRCGPPSAASCSCPSSSRSDASWTSGARQARSAPCVTVEDVREGPVTPA